MKSGLFSLAQHIVLVEPNYYSPFPPIGLLKLSAYERAWGNTTELVRKSGFPQKRPDKVYVTSLFTWAWRPVWQTIRNYKAWYPNVEIWLGGLYASLLPEHAKLSGADHIYKGIHDEAEEMLPDYSLVPDWNGSIIFASRGCNNNCVYCAVPKLEGKINSERASIKKFIWPGHTKLIFFDNNILEMRYWRDIFEEVIELDMEADFNQGLDARLLSNEAASLISKMKKKYIRLAYDRSSQKESVKRVINLLSEKEISRRRILVYTLFNFTENPNEFLLRVKEILGWGAVCYPMHYQPCNTLKRNSYVSPKWTPERLEMVERARRVIGYGGAFPPYEGLIIKFRKAKDFDEAFSLYPKNKSKKTKLASKLKQNSSNLEAYFAV